MRSRFNDEIKDIFFSLVLYILQAVFLIKNILWKYFV